MNKIIVGLLAATALFVTETYVLECLWDWHATKIGLPPIGFWNAAGLILLGSMISGAIRQDFTDSTFRKKDERPFNEIMVDGIAKICILWAFCGFGYLYHILGG